MSRNNMLTSERREAVADAHDSGVQGVAEARQSGEGELLRELFRALPIIRYGAITVALHGGRIVEIHKTERIRRNGNKGNTARVSHK